MLHASTWFSKCVISVKCHIVMWSIRCPEKQPWKHVCWVQATLLHQSTRFARVKYILLPQKLQEAFGQEALLYHGKMGVCLWKWGKVHTHLAIVQNGKICCLCVTGVYFALAKCGFWWSKSAYTFWTCF